MDKLIMKVGLYRHSNKYATHQLSLPSTMFSALSDGMTWKGDEVRYAFGDFHSTGVSSFGVHKPAKNTRGLESDFIYKIRRFYYSNIFLFIVWLYESWYILIFWNNKSYME